MENPSPKKPHAPLTLKQKAELYTERALKYLFGLSVALGKASEIAQNNYNLGVRHLGLGNYRDAIFRFKAVTWVEPKNVQAWYNLGTSYLADGKAGMAASAYRKALAIKPDYEEASYMLAIARGAKAAADELPKKMPVSLALSHFENLAAAYNREQVEINQYSGHTKLAELIRFYIVQDRVDNQILDLGCGTGLCSLPLKSLASQITGVDISDAMLSQAMSLKDANGKKVYDELIKREIREFLHDAPANSYDIVVAGVVFSFMGELSEVFKNIARIMKTGGVFAMSADILDGEGFRFDTQAGRFKFSRSYLQEIARASGLSEVKIEAADIYLGYKMWVCVFKKA